MRVNVTLIRKHSQAVLALVALSLAGGLSQAETHSNLQAVTSIGTSAWAGSLPYTMRGVLLCNPDEMLDSTPRFLPWNGGANMLQLGAEWQVTIQAVEPGDRGGTTCWMGQSYGNMPWLHSDDLSYSNEAWVPEILRLNFDPSSLHPFRAGDLVEITVREAEFYGGKRNINEAHDIDPAANFDIRLVTANYGLPAPEVITLTNVMQPGGTPSNWQSWPAIFDQTRATGAEHYQGMRVRLNNLTLVTTNGWNPTNAWAIAFAPSRTARAGSFPCAIRATASAPRPRTSSTPSGSSRKNPAPARKAPMATNCSSSKSFPKARPRWPSRQSLRSLGRTVARRISWNAVPI